MLMEMQPAERSSEPAATTVQRRATDRARPAPDNPTFSVLLVELLDSAQRALSGEGGEVRHFIAKAADLLDGEILARNATGQRDTAAPVNLHLAPWQARRVIEFIEANLAETIRLADLAEVARLGIRQFSRAFRSDFGASPYAYVLGRRIERAKEMLRGDVSLAHIAAKSGFADQPHLTRLFRRSVGISPARWRRRVVLRGAEPVASTVSSLGVA